MDAHGILSLAASCERVPGYQRHSAEAAAQLLPAPAEIAHKTLFGTDWPGPGVPEIKTNLDDFRALPLREETQREILSRTALKIWPA